MKNSLKMKLQSCMDLLDVAKDELNSVLSHEADLAFEIDHSCSKRKFDSYTLIKKGHDEKLEEVCSIVQKIKDLNITTAVQLVLYSERRDTLVSLLNTLYEVALRSPIELDIEHGHLVPLDK